MVAATRREARERALSLEYERETRGIGIAELLDALSVRPDAYAEQLARGVEQHRPEIDELLAHNSTHWTIDRMPAIDRAVLRIATFELLCEPDLASAVVINEAVDLAKQYSTKDSGRFVNGLLAKIAETVRAPVSPA
jgi:transcription antitermination protein NusB